MVGSPGKQCWSNASLLSHVSPCGSKSSSASPAASAVRYFSRLGRQDVVIDVESADLRNRTAAIARLKRAGEWELALVLLFRGAKRDVVAFTAAATVCAQAWVWAGAIALLEELQSAGIPPDRAFWNSVGAACSSAGKWRHALWLILDAPRAASLWPDAVAVSVAVTACKRGTQWEKALELLGEGASAGVHAYSSAIAACGAAFAWERSMQLWSDLCQLNGSGQGLRLRVTFGRESAANVVALNATLTALERAAKWPLALQLLKSGKVPKPDGISYSAAITACCNDRQWHLAVDLLWEARGLKKPPSAGALSCILRALGHQRAWQAALELHQLPCPVASHLDLLSSVAWVLEVPCLGSETRVGSASKCFPLQVAGRGHESPQVDIEALGRKQLALLHFVQRRAPQGNLEAILAEIVKFARRREWLKIAGGRKARLMEASGVHRCRKHAHARGHACFLPRQF